MKSFFTLSLHLLISCFLYSQSPLGIPYQAVMRNADGTVMASSAVSLTFMIHDATATGALVYQESHALTSNVQGLVSCVVGNGVVSQGNFATINWGGGAKFLHVMMGTTDMGTQQLLSVPYALYSNGVGVRVSETGDTLTIGGNSVIVPGISAANANNNNIPTSGLGAVVLPGNNTCADQFINVVGCNGQTSLTYDGRTYDLVEIGGQCWFADNLATDQYRNGDPIPAGLDNTTWQNTTSGAYAIYNNDPANDIIYGKLYNWYTTVDTRGLCPTGWHVPTDCEWMYLEGSLGMPVADQETAGWRGTNEGGALKATSNWNSPNTGATNSSGFSALPGGYRSIYDYYNAIGGVGYWWSSISTESGLAFRRELANDNTMVSRGNYDCHFGFSVRCLKDSETSPIPGCTDGSACNFLADATQDDGSCLYQNATCDDGDVNTVNDVINSSCQCSGTPSNTGATLLPGNTTCSAEVISVTGCGGQTSLTYDGRTYDLVEIGGQCWFADNLATDQYRNGDSIPTGLDNTTWQNTNEGAYAIYNNDPANDVTYGKLYNWYTTVDTRGLCPTGWHVPTDCEWMYLESILGLTIEQQIQVNQWRGTTQGGSLKDLSYWISPNIGATNSTGFSAFPAGTIHNGGTDSFTGIGYLGHWWSSTEFDLVGVFYRGLNHNRSSVYRNITPKYDGFSVRCVRD